MPSPAFGDMNSMIVSDANDEYRSYMLENIDLKLLRMSSNVARVGSFTRSATLMDVTQSAVSHGIKRLESQLGCSLFYKKGKSIHLTPEGRFFLSHMQRLLDLFDRIVQSVGAKSKTPSELGRVSRHPSALELAPQKQRDAGALEHRGASQSA